MMSLGHDDEESSVSSVSTYDPKARDDGKLIKLTPQVSNILQLIEQNSPDVTNLLVCADDDDDDDDEEYVEPSPFTREEWIRLGHAVGGNTTITAFRFYACDSYYGDVDPIQSTEVRDAFCEGLARNRSIQQLYSGGLDYTSGQIRIMSPFFVHNAHLIQVSFCDNALKSGDINLLTETIKERGENVKTIRSFDYRCSSVGHSQGQISALVDLAKACTHLTSLGLTNFESAFDLSSYHIIASYLASKHCMLKNLDLHGNRIEDDGCRVIAESLRINRRLRRLNMYPFGISSKGLDAFIPVVCDVSSIESTLNSNHTLEQVSKCDIAIIESPQ